MKKAGATKATRKPAAKAKPIAIAKPARGAAAGTDDFDGAFRELRELLAELAPRLVVASDNADSYYLNTHSSAPGSKSPMFFGAVARKKGYVSFYLMPVYVHPELLDAASPALRARMQGKSCFNFRAPDAALFRELRGLARKGLERFRKSGLA